MHKRGLKFYLSIYRKILVQDLKSKMSYRADFIISTFGMIMTNIAGFVTFIDFMMKGYLPQLHSALGVFLQLITVNCIILGRAEAFASRNSIGRSVLDGLGMGIGFTLALFAMGSVREILGLGSWFGMKIPYLCDNPMTIFIMPAGGFFVLGCLIALVNKIANRKPPVEISCANCPNASACKGQCKAEEGA